MGNLQHLKSRGSRNVNPPHFSHYKLFLLG